MTTKAHPVIFTIEFDILLKYWQAAGLDKTQQPYRDKWSRPIPPRENRVKVRIEAGKRNTISPAFLTLASNRGQQSKVSAKVRASAIGAGRRPTPNPRQR